MERKTIQFNQKKVRFYLDGNFSLLKEIIGNKRAILITDDHVFNAFPSLFKKQDVIVLKPGEQYKALETIVSITEELVAMEADRSTVLVGVGGGVITDITGFVASVYMRGIEFGFIPTTLLALVDASIGGKNGVDLGVYKNMVGVISQPSFILHDLRFLKSLPDREWNNGFAEIIKHAAIKDAAMFRLLEASDPSFFKKHKAQLSALIKRNVMIKARIVQQDEFEQGDRKLLNFGHTLGHALENQYELSHGEAISIGMTFAANLSASLSGFKEADRLVKLLEQYDLPTFASFNVKKVLNILKMDKKKIKDSINFILLNRIGKAGIKQIPVSILSEYLS